MTVVICQQEDFLQTLLEPYLAEHDITVEYSRGHHSDVASAVEKGEVDLAITHSKVKKMQKLERRGFLNEGKLLFANPMVFLGPKGDPAGLTGLLNPAEAIHRIHAKGMCFVINGHDRIRGIQHQLVAESGLDDVCMIESRKSSPMDIAFERNTYTMWALHPYSRKSQHRLEPVVIPEQRLLENMSGWVVAGLDSEEQANMLLSWLASEEAQKRVREFRLARYPQLQAWWPPRHTGDLKPVR